MARSSPSEIEATHTSQTRAHRSTGDSARRSQRTPSVADHRQRRRKKLRDAVYGVTKADIRRLARRGGVKRISANIHEEIRRAMKAFMHKVLGESVALAELCGRKTVCASDIVFALRRQGHTLYGFDNPQKKSRP